MSNQIYVIGHKSPDLDSVAAAIAYADFKNKFNNTTDYQAASAGSVNLETEFALGKFGFDAPQVLAKRTAKNLFWLITMNFPKPWMAWIKP